MRIWNTIQPIVADEADVVFGSRFQANGGCRPEFWHYFGNSLLTRLSNAFTGLKLTDVETCYKVFRRRVIGQIAPTLVERRFGVEPELAAKLARLPGLRVCERPIHYAGRTYAQGKKIGWRDGLRAVYCIVYYGLGG